MVAAPSKASKELAHAVYDDFKRKAIDAAKKRAAAQHVNYDTFKNLVSVAHLRPLQAPSVHQQGNAAPSWSFTPDGRRVQPGQEAAQAASQVLLSDTLPTQAPMTSGEFTRDWRRCCPTPDHKYRYLHLCGPQGLAAVFRVEVSTELLKDMLGVLHTCWLGAAGVAEEAAAGGALAEVAWLAQVLQALSSAGRFKLALQMLGPQCKQAVSELVSQLQEALAAGQAHTQQQPQQQDSNDAAGYCVAPHSQPAVAAAGDAGDAGSQLQACQQGIERLSVSAAHQERLPPGDGDVLLNGEQPNEGQGSHTSESAGAAVGCRQGGQLSDGNAAADECSSASQQASRQQLVAELASVLAAVKAAYGLQ